MDFIKPKCVAGNQCILVCNADKCDINPFICSQTACQCEIIHKKCIKTIQLKTFKQKFQTKIKNNTVEMKQYLESRQDELFRHVIHNVKIAYKQFKHRLNIMGLNQLEITFYNRFMNLNFTEMRDHTMHQLEKSYERVNLPKVHNIQNQIKQVKNMTQLIIKEINTMIKGHQMKTAWFDSKITDDFGTIQSFFTHKIKNIPLIYRASQNEFQTAKFWESAVQSREFQDFIMGSI